MADNITPEDVALAEQYKEIVEKINKTNKVDLETKIQLKNEEKSLKILLEDKFQKQAKFLTNAEIEVDLLERRQDLLTRQLAIAERRDEAEKDFLVTQEQLNNFAEDQNKLLERYEEISQEIATAQGDRLKELEEEQKKIETLANTEEKRKDALVKAAAKQSTEAEKLRREEGQTTEELRKQVKEGESLLRTGNKRKTVAQDVKTITQNTLASTLGIKSASSTITDNLIDAAVGAKKFKDVSDGISAGLKEAATAANIIKSTVGAIDAVARKAADIVDPIGTIKDMIMDIANTEAIFTKATGFANRFGVELEKLKLLESPLLLQELDKAFTDLLQSSIKFSALNAKTRKELAETAGLFARLGVDTKTFAKNLDNLTYTFGLSQQQVKKMTSEIIGFSRALGISSNEGLAEFNRQMNLIATHGLKRGTEIFKELQLNVKATSISMDELINIGKKFDTFDGAMEAAGKLNLILQGPYLNSMEMLNATEEKRLEILRNALKESGMVFEDLSRRQKEAFAGTLGVGVDVAQQLFQTGSLKTLDEARKSVSGRLEDEEALKDTSKDLLTVQEKIARAMQNSARAMTIMGKGLEDAVEALKGLNLQGSEQFGIIALLAQLGVGLGTIGAIGGSFALFRKFRPGPAGAGGGGGGGGGSGAGGGASGVAKGGAGGGAGSGASGVAKGSASSATPKGTGTTTGVKPGTPKLAAPPATGYTPPASVSASVTTEASKKAAETTTKASVAAAAETTKASTGFAATMKESGKEFLKAITNPKNIKNFMIRGLKGGIASYIGEKTGEGIGMALNRITTREGGRFGEQGTGIMRPFERPEYGAAFDLGDFLGFAYELDRGHKYDEGDDIGLEDILYRPIRRSAVGRFVGDVFDKINPFSFFGKKKGSSVQNFGNSFVGELGAEFIFDPQNRNFSLAGLLGAELRNISQSAEIFPAQQTAGMLATMENFSNAVANFLDFKDAAATQTVATTGGGGNQPINLHVSLEMDGQRFATLVETITADTLNQALS